MTPMHSDSGPPAPPNPFVGLRPFESEDRLYFFGRREQTVELLELLHDSRFLAVVGRSGCGKSSLVRAGLIPALEAGFLVGSRERWLVVTITPGNTPLRKLATQILVQGDKPPTPEQISEFVASSTRVQLAVLEHMLLHRLGDEANLLLIVDQFEEVFDSRSQIESSDASASAARAVVRSETEDFVALLLELPRLEDCPIFTVLTMRSDFLGDCDAFPGLPEAMNASRYLVPRLNRDQLRVAIEGPVLSFDAELEPRLLDRLLNEVGDRSEQLPVLQHALMCTWRERAKRLEKKAGPRDPALTADDYAETGKLEAALSRHAELAITLDNVELMAKLFKCLTQTDSEGRRKRRAQTYTQLEKATGASRAALKSCVAALRADQRYFITVEDEGNDFRLAISHESLIRVWGRLTQWVDEEREARDTLRDLVRRASLWARQNAPRLERSGEGLRRWLRRITAKDGFLEGPDLVLFQDWDKKQKPSPMWASRYVKPGEYQAARAFLDDSTRWEKGARYAWIFSVVAALAIMAGLTVFAGWKWHQANEATAVAEKAAVAAAKALEARKQAEQQTKKARELARSVSLYAGAISASDVALQVALLRESSRGDLPWTELALAALQSPIARLIAEPAASQVDPDASEPCTLGAVSSASMGRDGRLYTLTDAGLVAWTSSAKFARIVAAQTAVSKPLRILAHVRGPQTDYVLGEDESTTRLWTVGAGDALSPESVLLLDKKLSLNAVALGGADTLAVASTEDTRNVVRVWSAQTGTLRFEFSRLREGGSFASVALSPKGDWLAVARNLDPNGNGSLALVELPSPAVRREGGAGKPPRELPWKAVTGELTSVSFSPDGERVVLAHGNDASIWSVRGASKLSDVGRHEQKVQAAAFSPDGRHVATACWDNTARIWSLDSPSTPPLLLKGHEKAVSSVEFSGNAALATASLDGTARVWNLQPIGAPAVLSAHADTVRAVAFSPDDSQLVTTSDDKTAKLWDLATGQSRTVAEHDDVIWALAFNPDGTRIATGSLDGVVKITQLANRKTQTLPDMNAVYGLAFSREHLAVAKTDGSIELWNADGTGAPVVLAPRGKAKAWGVTFTAEGGVAGAFSDGTLRLWRANEWQVGQLLEGGPSASAGPAHAVAASAQGGGLLAWGTTQHSPQVWSLRDQRWLQAPSPAHSSNIDAVSFAADGLRLVTGSWDNTAMLWQILPDARTVARDPTLVLRGHSGRVRAVAFNHAAGDKERVATGADDGSVRVFRLLTPESIQLALTKATSYCLSVERRQGMLGDSPEDALLQRDQCRQQFGGLAPSLVP